MPALTKNQAVEQLAVVVETVKPSTLAEVYAELFPETPSSPPPSAKDVAQHIRNSLEAEEIVDVWNVVFPSHRNVWYDEEENQIHYNEEVVGYVDTD